MQDEINNPVIPSYRPLPVQDDINGTEVIEDVELPFGDNVEEDLRRWGFQQAIKDQESGLLTADKLIELYREKLTHHRELLENIYTDIQNRYDEKIAGLRLEKERLKQEKIEEDPTLVDLRKRKEALVEQMKDITDKVIEARKKMREGKADMMNKWIEEASEQVKKATALQKEIYDSAIIVNESNYNNEKPTLEKHIENWTNRRTQYQNRLTEVNKRLTIIGADGMNPAAASLLIGIGTTVAAAAGYFFSVFTSAANFGNQDAIYFLLNGFFKIGGSSGAGLLIKIVLLILFVLVIGVISYASHLVFEYFFGKKNATGEDSFRIRARSRWVKDKYDAGGEFSAGSWFSFWLQIGPALAAIGIVILILSLAPSTSDQLNRLNSSIEGMLTGTAVALGIGGMVCLYIMKVVEPRLLLKKEDEKGIFSWVKYNWELALCILFFIIVTMAIIFYPLTNSTAGNAYTNFVAVPEFIAVAFLSAFPFAYGIRFRGLVAVSRFLQREITWLDIHIAEYSTPEIPDVKVDFTEANNLIESILAVIHNKALLLRGITSEEDIKPVKNKEDYLRNAIRRVRNYISKVTPGLFGEKPIISPINRLTELADWERRYFPDIDEEIKILAFQYDEYAQELKGVVSRIEKLQDEVEAEKRKIEDDRKRVQQQIETTLTYKEKASQAKFNKISQSESSAIRAEAAILDGFHLGMWYRNSPIGPYDSFYLNIPPKSILPSSPPDSNSNNGQSIKLLR